MKQLSNLPRTKKARLIILLATVIVSLVAVYFVRAANDSGGCIRHDQDPKDHDYVVIQC